MKVGNEFGNSIIQVQLYSYYAQQTENKPCVILGRTTKLLKGTRLKYSNCPLDYQKGEY